MLGWHDPRTLLALARHARQFGWLLETRHFFDDALPAGWSGDGMLVSDPRRMDVLRFMKSQAPRQPTVLIERNRPRIKITAHVHEDNVAAGRMAAEHLLAMGHRRFVWWTSAPGVVAAERLSGFRDTLARHGCDCLTLEYRGKGGKGEWMRRRKWLAKHLAALEKPVALFAMDDQLAAEAVEMSIECGINVPRDLAVVGVGNIELASETSPVPITSIDNAPDAVAIAGAMLLDRLMAGAKPPTSSVVIPPLGLVVRQSSEALAVTHPALLRGIDHLRISLEKPFDMEQLAAIMGMSARSVYHLYRSELRCTPADFLLRERMSKAKIMLGNGSPQIKDLVSACGFGTSRTMNRIFLRHEGCCPRDWKSLR